MASFESWLVVLELFDDVLRGLGAGGCQGQAGGHAHGHRYHPHLEEAVTGNSEVSVSASPPSIPPILTISLYDQFQIHNLKITKDKHCREFTMDLIN